MANYVRIQRLSFASTPSPYRYADDLQDLFVGIATARLLPGASTTLNSRMSLPTFSGVTHISIISSADTTLLSHQHRRRISNRPNMSQNVCEMRILSIVNSVYSRFRSPDHDDPIKIETPFIISFPLMYTACSPFGRATRLMLAFNIETREVIFLKDYWRADVDGMEKAKFTRYWFINLSSVLICAERTDLQDVIWRPIDLRM